MSFENANPNAGQQQMEGISDLPAADGLAMLAAVTPAPKQRKKEVKSQRSKDIAHFKTKAFDACGILIEAKWMTDPGDHEGLRAHLECAQELEKSCADEVASQLRYQILSCVSADFVRTVNWRSESETPFEREKHSRETSKNF